MTEILNERAYRQAKASLRDAKTQRQAVALASSIAGYETLRTAGGMSLELNSLRDLGRALIKARIARGWTQERLAEELGMPKQQIQRYEATEYVSASLRRLLKVSEALDISLTGSIHSGPVPEPASELARSLAGYAAAEAVQEVERRIRLRRMTTHQARGLFDDLCDTYYRLAPLHRPAAEGSGGMDHRVAVRKALETLARRRGGDR
jgi:transcriptional regulator with XRE-family HTH domain